MTMAAGMTIMITATATITSSRFSIQQKAP
jgi:hypothetical protein